MVAWVSLQFVIVPFPCHTHYFLWTATVGSCQGLLSLNPIQPHDHVHTCFNMYMSPPWVVSRKRYAIGLKIKITIDHQLFSRLNQLDKTIGSGAVHSTFCLIQNPSFTLFSVLDLLDIESADRISTDGVG